jgi:hypothetical protein
MEVAVKRNWKVVNTFNGGTIQEEMTRDEAFSLACEKSNGAPVPSDWEWDFHYGMNRWTWFSPDKKDFMV